MVAPGSSTSSGPWASALHPTTVVALATIVATGLLALLIGPSWTLAGVAFTASVSALVVTDRRARARATALARAERLHIDILDEMSHAVMVLDHDGLVAHINPALQRLLHLPPERGPGEDPRTLVGQVRDSRGTPVGPAHLPWVTARTGTATEQAHLRIDLLDGDQAWLSVTARRIRGDTGGTVVISFDDVTLRVARERESADETAQLRHKALHDSLTGLPNRGLLMERMSRRLHGVPGARGIAVLMIDLDGFKGINDTLGHEVGDEILVQVAVRLRMAMRGRDLAVRLGGDEFVILCEDLHPDTMQLEMARIIRRIDMALDEPYVTSAGFLDVGASMGWAMAGPDETLDLDILNRADERMLAEKRRRRPGDEASDETRSGDRSHRGATPVITAPGSARGDGTDDGDGRARPVSVFIVDDDPAMRLLARRIIESSSTPLHVTGEFSSGAEAIPRIVEEHPDLVLCDVMMPDVAGPDVVNAVLSKNPAQSFVFWSATATDALERHRNELGVPFATKDRIEQLPGLLMSFAQPQHHARPQGSR